MALKLKEKAQWYIEVMNLQIRDYKVEAEEMELHQGQTTADH